MQRSNNSNNNNRSRNNNTPGLWHFCYSFERWLAPLFGVPHTKLSQTQCREQGRGRGGISSLRNNAGRQQRRRRPVATPAGRVSDAASTSNFACDSASSPVRNTNHLPAFTKSLRKLKSQKSKRQKATKNNAEKKAKKRLKKIRVKSQSVRLAKQKEALVLVLADCCCPEPHSVAVVVIVAVTCMAPAGRLSGNLAVAVASAKWPAVCVNW